MQKFTEEELQKIYSALEFASNAHGNQKYGELPYHYHLIEVADAVEYYNGTVDNMIVAFLHDVIEDTKVTKEQIQKKFGEDIAHVVDLLTNRESKEETYTRIRTNKNAVFVKLCDRLSNVTRAEKLPKYRAEHEVFRSILYQDDEFSNLWNAIENKLNI